MIFITPNSISGINSITAQSGNIQLFNSSGGTGTINGNFTGTITDIPISGNRNKIINGDMRIDQRGAGSSFSPNANGIYTLDRWLAGRSSLGESVTIIRSTNAPYGFTNSLLWTTVSASPTLTGIERGIVQQRIEGYNMSDLSWGTPGAVPITLSFWVRSSSVGTFGGNIRNGLFNRSYIFTYSVTNSNTWEYKTIIIPGDTTGTWYTDNQEGMRVSFSMGAGPTYTTSTVNSWISGDFQNTTGTVSIVTTAGATWQITGVQVEPGTFPTPFERRSYGQELVLCQRYYGLYSAATSSGAAQSGYMGNAPFRVSMRAAPTLTVSSNIQGTLDSFNNTTSDYTITSHSTPGGTARSLFTASAEL